MAKNTLRRIISVIITTVLLLSLLPTGVVSVSAGIQTTSVTAEQVIARANELNGKIDWRYNDGKYTYCLLFVSDFWSSEHAFPDGKAGLGFQGSYGWGSAYKYCNNFRVSTSMDNIPIGADVFFDDYYKTYGHIGIYLGNGQFLEASGEKIRISSFWGDKNTGDFWGKNYLGWGWHQYVSVQTITPENIGNDFYAYISKNDTGINLAAKDSNVEIPSGNDDCDPKQIWHFVRSSDGYYRISNEYDGKRLHAWGRGIDPDTNVGVHDANDSDAQKWYIVKGGHGGGYTIAPVYCDLRVDVAGNSTAEGTNIRLWGNNGTAAESFNIRKISGYSKPAKPTKSGVGFSLSTSNVLTLSWTASPLVNEYDSRVYDLYIYKDSDDSTPIHTKTNLSATSYKYTLSSEGTYYVKVFAINTRYKDWYTISNTLKFDADHNWSEWIVIKNATCTEAGKKTRTCSNCGKTEEIEIPALGHDYRVTTTEPTCISFGSRSYMCRNCNERFTVNNGEWSGWHEGDGSDFSDAQVEVKTQYRYKQRSVQSSEWKQSGTGTIDHAVSWPSGFDKSSSLYTKYNKSASGYENSTTKRVINSDSKIGYVYWHWCRGATNGPSNRLIEVAKTGDYTTFHAFYSTEEYELRTFTGYDPAYVSDQSSLCKDSYYWLPDRVVINRASYTDYTKENTYVWSDFSNWQDTPVQASNDRIVETRQVYRFKYPGQLGDHKWDSGEITVAPTATKPGIVTYTCTVCGETRMEILPALGDSIKGDADGDGEITVADALIALRIAAKLAPEASERIALCDADGDGYVTVADALKILRVAAKLVASL